MKVNGESFVGCSVAPCTLPRGTGELTLWLSPLPLGFHRRLRERGICPPAPRVKLARDSQGRPLRDASGTAVTVPDSHHPEYLLELERYHQRVAVLAVSEGLRNDPQLEFESKQPRSDEPAQWTEFADARFAELEGAGFSAGDLLQLCREVCRLSNLLEEEVRGAQRNFSLAGTKPAD